MHRTFQRVLLVAGIVALLVLLTEIGLSVAATMHGNQPARVVHVKAGPYPLTVSLYTDPARAGFALPFAIVPDPPLSGLLAFDVSSSPGKGVDAMPVHASLMPDANVRNGVQGTAEITVQGRWDLLVSVDGPQGPGEAAVPLTATAPPAIPPWLGWIIGLIPLYGLPVFLLLQRGRQTVQLSMTSVLHKGASSDVGLSPRQDAR